MYCCWRCLTGVHVLQDGISYMMICGTGGHILLYKDKFNWRVCPIGSHVLHESLQVDLCCSCTTCNMSGHVLFKHMK